jgi:hypothetical protein
MYIVDTGIFYSLGSYFPLRFPTFWSHIDKLIAEGKFWSTREVRREIEHNCPFEHVSEWVKFHHEIFRVPTVEEQKVVREMFKAQKGRDLVRRNNILKGLPVADPFVIAAAKISGGKVITRESFKAGGARIPTICKDLGVECINLEDFLTAEGIRF